MADIFPVRFRKRLGVKDATFVTPRGNEILIVDIPTGEQFTPGNVYALTIVPVGVVEGVNAIGGPVIVPVARFVSAPDF
jgi:hypothetical protein